MKNLVLFILGMLFCVNAHAQTQVWLNIHHKLGDEVFMLDATATNNLGNEFIVSRLQYYISEISIIHDGQKETHIVDKYELADASRGTNIDLGNLNINTVEAIRFHVGVDSVRNHSDPAAYPSEHPLSPKFPAMHWGWSAGYRFIAFEGNSGDGMNQVYQLHGLGDQNYFMTEVPVSLTTENGEIAINLDADYSMLLEDIDVDAGVIVHGDYGAAKKSLENFRDYVFSAAAISSTFELSDNSSFEIFPNPGLIGETNVRFSTEDEYQYEIRVSDILGRNVINERSIQSSEPYKISLTEPGLYFISLIRKGQHVLTKQLLIH